MKTITYLILGVILFFLFKRLLNTGGCVGVVIGVILGSSLGVAGGGGADNGLLIFGAVGFIIGGLIGKNKN